MWRPRWLSQGHVTVSLGSDPDCASQDRSGDQQRACNLHVFPLNPFDVTRRDRYRFTGKLLSVRRGTTYFANGDGHGRVANRANLALDRRDLRTEGANRFGAPRGIHRQANRSARWCERRRDCRVRRACDNRRNNHEYRSNYSCSPWHCSPSVNVAESGPPATAKPDSGSRFWTLHQVT